MISEVVTFQVEYYYILKGIKSIKMTFSNVSDNNYYLHRPGFNPSSRAAYTIFHLSTNNFYTTMSVGRALLLNPESKNVSANQRPGQPSCFSNRPEKHKLGRGSWDLASCKVSLNSVQWFQRRSRKCLSQSEARAAILFFPIGPKNTNLVEDIEILLPVKFDWILFSGFRGEVENVSANQRPGRPSCFSDRSEKHKLGRGHWDLASCQVWLNSVQRFQRRSRKCLSQSEARAAILFFGSARKTQTW